MDFRSILKCKPFLWGLFGVFLLGFGGVGLTTCSDGSKRIAQIEELEQSNDSLRNSVAALTGERDTLSGNLSDTTGNLAAVTAERDSLNSLVGTVRSNLIDLGAEGDDATAQVSALGAKLTELTGERDGLAAQVSDLEAAAENTQLKISGFEGRIAQQATEIQGLETELAGVREESAAKTADLESQVQDLGLQLTAVTDERDAIMSAYQDDKAQFADLQNQLALAATNLDEAQNTISTQEEAEAASLLSGGTDEERTSLLLNDRDNSLEALTRSLESSRRTRASLTDEINALNDELDNSRAEIRTARTELRALEDERAELEVQNSTLTDELGLLKTQADKTVGADVLAETQAKLAGLEETQDALEEANNAVTRLTNENDRLKVELAETTGALEDVKAAANDTSEIDALRAALTENEGERNTLVLDIENLRTELSAAQDEVAAQTALAEAAVADANERTNEEAAQRLSLLGDQKTQAEGEVNRLQLALTETQIERDGLVETIEKLRFDIDESAAAASARIAALDATAAEGQAEIEGLKGSIEAATARSDELQTLLSEQRARNEELERSLTAEQGAQAELQSELAEIEGIAKDAADAAGDLVNERIALTAELDGVKSELAKVEGIAKDAADTAADLVGERNALTAELTDLKGVVSERDGTIAELTAGLEGAKSDLDAALKSQSDMQGLIADRDAEIAGLKAGVSTATATVAATASEVSSLQAQIDDLTGQLQERNGEIATVSNIRDRLEAQLADTKGNLDTANAATTAANADIVVLEEKVAALTDELQNRTGSLNAATRDKTEIMSELDGLRSRLSAAEEDRDGATAKVDSSLNRIAALQRQINAMRRNAGESQGALKSELEETREALAGAEERATRFGTMLSEAPTREQLDATIARLSDVSNTANALQNANVDLEGRLNALTEDQATRAVRLGAMQGRMAELRIENQDLQNELSLLAAAPPTPVAVISSEDSDALRTGLISALGSDAVINDDGSFALSSSTTFAVGSATLSAGGQQVLTRAADEIVNFLNQRPDARGIIVVEGHTDADPINTVQFPSNWALSAARAGNAVNFLISRGVPANRIRAEAYAATRPVDPGTSREAFARNRRIQFDFTPE